MTDFLSFQRHVTASRLKIHQQQQQPPDKTFPFLLMAFVFDHVTRLGLGAMSPTGPSGNWLSQKGCSLKGRRGGGAVPSSLLSPAMATRAANYPPDTAEVSLGKVFKSALRELLLTE